MTVLGLNGEGKLRRRFFKAKSDAERFLDEHLRLSADPLQGRRHEVMFCLERTDRLGVSLNDVVEFYLKHGSKRTAPPLSEAIPSFLDHKRMVGRGNHYLNRMGVVLRQLAEFVGDDVKVGDITSDQLRKFVYVAHGHTSPKSKQNLLTHLSVFFGFCVRHDLSSLNPVTKVERPTVKFSPPSVMSPEDFSTLLHFCLENRFHDRLTIFVLVGFCGVSSEEASKLKWSDIHFENKTVLVPAHVAKKHGFRMNKIPPNGLEWLRRIRDRRRTGPIVGPNWKTLLRSVVRSAKVPYGQNRVRHSFCSYALSSGVSLSEVVQTMGHGGSPTMVFSHYRNVVSEEDGRRWFGIVPPAENPSVGIVIGKGDIPDEEQTQENRP